MYTDLGVVSSMCARGILYIFLQGIIGVGCHRPIVAFRHVFLLYYNIIYH